MAAKKIDYLDFFKTVGKSKRLLRSGWVREKVEDPESVAEHSFRVGVLAIVLADKFGEALDREKLVKMALLHDLGEVITGDIVTERGEIIDIKGRDEKEAREREGIREIFDKIGEAEKYLELYDEMIGAVSEEAKVFKQLDKFEMALQALEYEEEQGKNLNEFFMNVDLYGGRFPFLKELFTALLAKRKRSM